MSSLTMLFILVGMIAVLFLGVNFLLAPHNPYQEKDSVFECGFHSYLQSSSSFNMSFFMFALMYLILDLEMMLMYPYALSSYENDLYGLIVVLIFMLMMTAGFVYELGKNALKMDSSQTLHMKF